MKASWLVAAAAILTAACAGDVDETSHTSDLVSTTPVPAAYETPKDGPAAALTGSLEECSSFVLSLPGEDVATLWGEGLVEAFQTLTAEIGVGFGGIEVEETMPNPGYCRIRVTPVERSFRKGYRGWAQASFRKSILRCDMEVVRTLTGVDLTYVMQHELGHCLGLDHDENDPMALMHPHMHASKVWTFTDREKTRLREIWGAK